MQLGELVIATGADALDPETLAGALLKTMEANDAPRREAWRKRGANHGKVLAELLATLAALPA